jgi:hypothetical protein
MLFCGAGLLACGSEEGGSVVVAKTRPDGSKLSKVDREAADFVRTRIEEHWAKGSEGWTTELQQRNVFGQTMPGIPEILYRQCREMEFMIDPEAVTEAQRLNGADYRAVVEFARTPERVYRTVQTWEGPEGWSSWEDGIPAYALAVERRNGEWLIEEDGIFQGLKPETDSVPAGGSTP